MWPNPHFPVDLIKFTEETLMDNLIFVRYIQFRIRIFFPCMAMLW